MGKEVRIHYHQGYKVMFYNDMDEWKGRYKIYAQNVNGRIYVTFRDDNADHIHFNDSHSICINEFYGNEDLLLEMIETAKKCGWKEKENE